MNRTCQTDIRTEETHALLVSTLKALEEFDRFAQSVTVTEALMRMRQCEETFGVYLVQLGMKP